MPKHYGRPITHRPRKTRVTAEQLKKKRARLRGL